MLSTSARKLAATLIPLLCLAGLLSCEKDGPQCYVPTLVRVGNSFTVIDTTHKQVDSFPVRDSLIYVYKDSAMLASQMRILNETLNYTITGTDQANARQMHIALNPLKDSTRYAFRADTASNVWDTITYYYTPESHFVSNSCGYTYYYTITGVKTTKNIFDSAILRRSDVTTDISVRHVQLYFKSKF
ncbi:DUF6452 family protein [Taibaiella koreensis]|uniref:DUF6452 family protein n=1 Tax=Taibaiella koreensis TaxID=1268548 RepID=UPI000E59E781|nr:DUF6452 family protein [Taibaiella koreensis]